MVDGNTRTKSQIEADGDTGQEKVRKVLQYNHLFLFEMHMFCSDPIGLVFNKILAFKLPGRFPGISLKWSDGGITGHKMHRAGERIFPPIYLFRSYIFKKSKSTSKSW